MFPKKELAQLVISACHQFKIDTIVISPGSRNAPLTIGFFNHPKMKTLSIVDERCAAFFALGIAQQTQKPVAIVCTSGSALLNYYPAISEAFYSNIPLVVISADRPKHLIDIGDGQTIRQENVFANHILFSANLIENSKSITFNSKLISEALQISTTKKAPIHINVPFDELLYETVDKLQEFNLPDIFLSKNQESNIDFKKLSEIWNSSDRKLILIGANLPDDELQNVLNKFADNSSVLIMTETTSNLHNKKFINSIDKLIFSSDDKRLKELQPDILVTLGGMVVSKKIKKFLRTYQPKYHWCVNELKETNTYHCLSEFIQQKPTKFLSQLCLSTKNIESNYQKKWLSEKIKTKEKHRQYLQEIEHSDLKVFEQVLESIPDNCQLQLGNSSIVRYSQLFDVNTTLNVFCNRGTSGIDGCTSTAIGAAFSEENQTVFITGDLSFFYDSNALWNNYIPKNFRVIIINNSGGGIFRFIPGPKTTNALDYFETPHNLTAEYLCKMYDFEYHSVSDSKSLEIELKGFYLESKQPKIMEIFTDGKVNEKILNEYFNFLK